MSALSNLVRSMFLPRKSVVPVVFALLAVVNIPLNAAPICQSALSDSDNDGWGWENNESCRVVAEDPSEDGFCASARSDPDGDGWGWEKNRSCKVKTTDDDTPPQPDSKPICNSPDSDPDNDGWGWENNQSCLVQKTQAKNHRIMPVGDSITHGHRSVNSYRKPLEILLNTNNCDFTYVGSQQKNYFFDGYRAPHEGYSGHTADDFLYGRNNAAGDNRGIDDSMARFDPEVVLLHIGSNDINRGHSISSTVAEIDQIISIIHQHNNDTLVLLANVIPWYRAPQQSVFALGNEIEAYVNQLADQRVKLVDVRSGYSRDMMISDGIHPNASGEAHIADAFFNVYDELGLCD